MAGFSAAALLSIALESCLGHQVLCGVCDGIAALGTLSTSRPMHGERANGQLAIRKLVHVVCAIAACAVCAVFGGVLRWVMGGEASPEPGGGGGSERQRQERERGTGVLELGLGLGPGLGAFWVAAIGMWMPRL
jgi:hypothetical protein